VTPLGFPTDSPGLPIHDHSGPSEGGKIGSSALEHGSGIAQLDTADTQTFAGPVGIPDLSVNESLTLGNDCALILQDIVNVPTVYDTGANGLTEGCETLTATRAQKKPDTSGTGVMSKAVVTRTAKTANDSATILTAPDAGLYLLAWYVEVTSADATGVISLDLTAVGAGGTCTQPVLATFSMSAKAARSGLAVVYVASGNVTGATTLASLTGTQVYDWRVIPIGRIA